MILLDNLKTEVLSYEQPLEELAKSLHLEDNEKRIEEWGNHYIDLIEPVLDGDNVKVFTDDNRFISQDCRHLTEAGAEYYARLLDFSQYMP